ncbi:hypothetical protein HDA32_004263 [Spinactinospora alkalitolerans]|uniref:DUF4352 domain-containing protein n=1 Tax=Spinactinospora alkalitolerans TaxID=687207 RepID=A0A852U2H1_9ACTN|nr:hypothetical protein [Spinactinospora alkalitolerans]NYE49143.1 hypothetical protein [Spinactinospora alkalitolerans]
MTPLDFLKRRGTAAIALASCTLLLAGCGLFGGDPEEEGAEDSGSGGEPVNAGAVDPGEAEPRETLASQDFRDDGSDLHIAVHELARRGETVELTFSVTNTGDTEWDHGGFFSGGNVLSDDKNTVASVELIDARTGRLHLVARDADGACVCSTPGYGFTLGGGDSLLLSATYGAPPEEIETMGVRIPGAGTFNDVPLS